MKKAFLFLWLFSCALPAEAFTLSNFEVPESILVDPQDGSYYVSNVNGAPADKDANGYISKIDPKGSLVIQKFITGNETVPLHAPKGLALVGDILFVTDIDSVKGYDKRSGAPLVQIDFSEFKVKFLNDIAAVPGGLLYISDMHTDRIFKLATKDNYALSVFVEGDFLGNPNGLVKSPGSDNLLVATWASGQVLEIDPSGKVEVLKTDLMTLDGIDYDKEGNLYVASFEKGEIYKIAEKGRGTLTTFLSGLTTPADISFDRKKSEVLIPSFNGNTIAAVASRKIS